MGTRAKTYRTTAAQPTRRVFATRAKSEQYKAAQRFYASAAWRRLRTERLNHNPLCTECLKHDHVEPAVDVDHVLPRDTHPELALDYANLQCLCKSHHTAKTRREHAKGKTGSYGGIGGLHCIGS